MDWLNSVFSEIQKRFLGVDGSPAAAGPVAPSIEERRTSERVQLFQWRLSELDRRLSRLR
ncbi:MAG TPA: hypothetical protein VM285_01590 [Polyangia bacterium]|nr:hypothetical protein [Polyangia bacterium]